MVRITTSAIRDPSSFLSAPELCLRFASRSPGSSPPLAKGRRIRFENSGRGWETGKVRSRRRSTTVDLSPLFSSDLEPLAHPNPKKPRSPLTTSNRGFDRTSA
ncbi:hypothetical protein BHM03_00032424 [Ensete ventricosum]|uniref:Uncharacterized protein n=1 Tax=Ensete ventricosum TaxID=4639 RepID=A0A426ZJN4_ENSVE|nr:hypothetical protein B296_00025236 [Ensete ventricosum]RZS02386.1 hypothetical protein BHM03_00032424 [Ensete ventricosum]